MQVHTRKHRTDTQLRSDREDIDTPMSIEEFASTCFGDLPPWAVALSGLRHRESLTQVEFGEKIGVEQTNISKMEHGKRPVGKTLAKRIAKIFHTDYHLFL